MTEPTDEEIERAERIKRLRAGEAVPRRGRRRPDPPDDVETPEDGAREADDEADADGAGDDEVVDDHEGADGDPDPDHDGPLDPDGLELPADAPGDLTVASLYLTEDLRERLLELEAHLDALLGRNFDGDVDGPRHVRPLALYLGVRQIEKLEAAEIVALFESIDEIESP